MVVMIFFSSKRSDGMTLPPHFFVAKVRCDDAMR
jgi:hypothetical protein